MSAVIDILDQSIRAVGGTVLGLSTRLNPLYLLAMIPLAWVVYRLQKPQSGFWTWLLPREIYAHPSTQTDIKLFLVGALIKVAGFVNFTVLHILIIYALTQGLGKSEVEPGWVGILVMTLTIATVSDFCVYWIHRGHHEIKLIWPFHAVHHSAEVMSPITVSRKHPVYNLLSRFVTTIALATVQGLILSLFFGQISLAVISGVTVTTLVFNLLGSNFRHSHIWISYGPFFSRIFISPAQHQIHHSLAHKHWHKNYGEIFALWDWAFGTLYVPETHEALEFGLSTPDGRRIEQPHPTATDALCGPFRDAAAYLKSSHKPAAVKETP